MAHGKLHHAQKRSYRDPELAKLPFTMNITEAQREIFKYAVKLSGMH